MNMAFILRFNDILLLLSVLLIPIPALEPSYYASIYNAVKEMYSEVIGTSIRRKKKYKHDFDNLINILTETNKKFAEKLKDLPKMS